MLPVPTPRLAALAAAGALLALVAPRPWTTIVAWNAVAAVAALVDLARAPRIGDVGVARDAPDVLTLGSEAEVTWTLVNPLRRRTHVAIADDLVGSLGAPSRRVAVPLGPRQRAFRRVTIRPTRRGRFQLGDVTVRASGPWGLSARQGTRHVPHVLTVHPPFRSRAETELRLQQARRLDIGVRVTRARGEGMEFDSLREYTVDDELRRIDWAATARASQPIARTYRTERNQTVLVLVDCGRTMAAVVEAATAGSASTEQIPRLEHAMDAAQAVTRLATGLGDRVGVVAFAERIVATVPPRTRSDQLRRVTGAFADLEAQLVESDYRGAFAHTLTRFPRRALLVVLTELANEAAEQTLLPALPLLRRRHLVAVAAVRDPVVERWRTQRSETVEQTYRRAAAIRTLDRRAATARALRTAGARVVDAVPGQLAAAVSETYLDTKAAGRL